ncbi:hypothetical protein CIB84_010600, partial [Bambusicola thoracicus]
YPFALFQRYFLFQKETYLIHLYNVFTGLSIAYFNFGLAIDYYDGGKDPELLTPEQCRFAVRGVPTLLEVSGFSYFYGAFMVGPQFSMTDYQKLAKGEMTDVPGQRPNSFVPALKRLSLGLLFLVTYTLSSPYISEEYLISDDYMRDAAADSADGLI